MLSEASESIIFMYLGVALVRINHVWNWGFIGWACLLCLLARFIVTYGLSTMANIMYRGREIDVYEQFIMAYGGLRGAVAFCLVALLDVHVVPPKDLFLTTTLIIILFTVFIQGVTIKPIVKFLRIKGESEKVLSMFQEINHHMIDHMMVCVEEVTGHVGENTLKKYGSHKQTDTISHIGTSFTIRSAVSLPVSRRSIPHIPLQDSKTTHSTADRQSAQRCAGRPVAEDSRMFYGLLRHVQHLGRI